MAATPVRAFAALLLLLPASLGQTPAAPSHLNAEDESDSYAIYSLLLKSEMPPQWKINSWSIAEKTATFSRPGSPLDAELESCLKIPAAQESIYRPLFQDYLAKNQKEVLLEQKFELSSYVLISASQKPQPGIIFQVSAVGFSENHTRALVYVGHHCGSLCGGGTYHLMVKKAGRWQPDKEYSGTSCSWAS